MAAHASPRAPIHGPGIVSTVPSPRRLGPLRQTLFRATCLYLLASPAIQASPREEPLLDPRTPADVITIQAIQQDIPQDFSSSPVVGMLHDRLVTIHDSAVKGKGQSGGTGRVWEAETITIDFIQKPEGIGAASFMFTFDAQRESLWITERRRIRGEHFLRLQGSRVNDQLLDNDQRMQRYRYGRLKTFTIPDVQVGDFIEVRQLSFSDRKTTGRGFGEIHTFNSSTPVIRQRLCYQMSPRVVLHYRLWDPANTVTVEETDSGDQHRICFTRQDQAPEVLEPEAPVRRYDSPSVMVTTAESWYQAGRWLTRRYWGRLRSTAPIKALSRGLISGLSRNEAVAAIYYWIRDNISYVPTTMNLDSGWNPTSADEVLANGYGDAVERASLLISMLNVAGIRAFPVFISTTSVPDAELDFPLVEQFNHMLVWVEPMDLYLDLMDLGLPFDYLPPSDQGRSALVLRDGRLEAVTTPVMDSKDSFQSQVHHVIIQLQPDHPGKVQLLDSSTCQFRGPRASHWHKCRWLEKTELDRFVAQAWRRNGDVERYDFQHDLSDFSNPVVLTLESSTPLKDLAWDQETGILWLLLPQSAGLLDRSTFQRYPQRIYPFQWAANPWREERIWEYAIPPGFHVATMPGSLDYRHPDGIFSYQLKYQMADSSTLRVTETLQVDRPVLEPETYMEIRQLLNNMADTINNRVLLQGEPH